MGSNNMEYSAFTENGESIIEVETKEESLKDKHLQCRLRYKKNFFCVVREI